MKKYGLLGEKLGHSYSKIIHSLIFELEGIDATYELCECDEKGLKDYLDRLRVGEYSGFNVTIPYKIEVMKYLDRISLEAEKIGSVNTITLEGDSLVGYNTDYFGFLMTLEEYQISCRNKNCYILGTGGASLAIKQAIIDKGGNPIFVSRDKAKKHGTIDYIDLDRLTSIEVLINTTPVGMYPNVDASVISSILARKVDVCIDIIFNPLKTKLLSMVKNGYNGLLMLVGQALKAEEIWAKREFLISPNELIKRVVKIINE